MNTLRIYKVHFTAVTSNLLESVFKTKYIIMRRCDYITITKTVKKESELRQKEEENKNESLNSTSAHLVVSKVHKILEIKRLNNNVNKLIYALLWNLSCLAQLLTQPCRPIDFWWAFRDKNVISFTTQACYQSQITAKNIQNLSLSKIKVGFFQSVDVKLVCLGTNLVSNEQKLLKELKKLEFSR